MPESALSGAQKDNFLSKITRGNSKVPVLAVLAKTNIYIRVFCSSVQCLEWSNKWHPCCTNFSRGNYDFSPLRRRGSNPGRWHGEPKSTTARTEGQSGDMSRSTCVIRHYIITIVTVIVVTRDDKRDKFTLQTDLSKCGMFANHATVFFPSP